ncbi:ribonuclease HI [Ancylostoma ceylanicum]|uniref:Ribonuclease HI n=1 Tax=Ancylostoma ceylanicum TaxID=53326 RepID=A0A0D6LFS4_9BILA|nr:ribonuclease HI [Ancylostoma ceylanicum]
MIAAMDLVSNLSELRSNAVPPPKSMGQFPISQELAWKFWRDEKPSRCTPKANELQRDKSPLKEWNKRFPEGTIVVYTDGSCIDNRASGFGVYFGPDHELNRSERIIGPIHNSGLAEILGAQTALRSLRNWRGYKNEPVILRTDFLPLVRAMQERSSYGRFDEEMDEVRRLAMSFPNGVQFQHVYAHDGDPGNEQTRWPVSPQLMPEELDPRVCQENASGGIEGEDRPVGTEDFDRDGGRVVQVGTEIDHGRGIDHVRVPIIEIT